MLYDKDRRVATVIKMVQSVRDKMLLLEARTVGTLNYQDSSSRNVTRPFDI
jgi:hypothetical protein